MPRTSAPSSSIAQSQASAAVLDHLNGVPPVSATAMALQGLNGQTGPFNLFRQRASAYYAHRWVYLAVMVDFIVVLIAMSCAFWTRFITLEGVGRFDSLELRTYGGHLVLGSLALIAMFTWQGIYRRETLLQFGTVNRKMAKGIMLWTLGFLLFALVFDIKPSISRIYMALAGAWCMVLLISWRQLFKRILNQPAILASLQKRTLILGTEDDVAELVKRFQRNNELSSKITGWVQTTENGPIIGDSAGIPCLGYVSDLGYILEKRPCENLILTDLSGPRERSLQIANICEREMVAFKIIPSCFRIFVSGLKLENVANTPIVGVSSLPLDDSVNALAKRCLDILGGLIGLLLFGPIMALFAFMVWVESRGSVIYRQKRTGADGRNFTIFKIRSMKLDAEAKGGAQWCKADDPRRLRVGAFMRKWNIDELPQFWNVLKGEMSLVGPRPERPELIAQFKHQIPHYNARHHALPGMTGWAQVRGLRGDTDLSERIRADIWYLENWSLYLDLKIMLLTFFKRDNAY
jgi:exopolysaccharide biosynthesis polyprenyl glycosylphosphotransferase